MDRPDVAGDGRIGLELAAQVLDVAVDRPLVRLQAEAVDGIEQLAPGEDAARLAGQRRQELEFGRRQLDGPARQR